MAAGSGSATDDSAISTAMTARVSRIVTFDESPYLVVHAIPWWLAVLFYRVRAGVDGGRVDHLPDAACEVLGGGSAEPGGGAYPPRPHAPRQAPRPAGGSSRIRADTRHVRWPHGRLAPRVASSESRGLWRHPAGSDSGRSPGALPWVHKYRSDGRRSALGSRAFFPVGLCT